MNNFLLVLTGKTAAGKDCVMNLLLKKYPDLRRVITTTTRPPRQGETNGKDYFFITREDFERKIGSGDFAEYVEYAGNFYGTEKQHLKEAGKSMIWRIDPSRAAVIRNIIPDGTFTKIIVIYLTVSDDVVLKRLEERRLSRDEIDLRMKEDRSFWKIFKDKYDYVVENVPGELHSTIDKISGILENQRP